MSKTPNYITPEGLEVLRREYSQLFHEERPKLVETIAWAASNGDRSENADYIYGKRRLREIDRRLRFLAERIEDAQIVERRGAAEGKIVFGNFVTVEDENGEQKTYHIVGEDESDAGSGKISWRSPLATALLGKRAGDEVTVKRPKGEAWLQIIEVK